MDDIQDYWYCERQLKIINLHRENKVPIKLAVIAGAIGENDELICVIRKGIKEGIITLQNHAWSKESICGLNYSVQYQIINNSTERIRTLFNVRPREFVPPMWMYDNVTLSVLKDLNIELAVIHQYTVLVTEYDRERHAWKPFNMTQLAQQIEEKLERYGMVEIYIHFQSIKFEEYEVLFYYLLGKYGLGN